ncbi:splicing factor, CC1-like protein [Aaosphaeria arxii CBS 175.79]|uniref:Splicing factor, CC1-like protein n=1 Tax=Aaosphaeria arxii CBS 175.79 TaxID=1450172 RepID=A0A6A5XDV8_9PLEO|nr:splicing factor, CC1-like protein [Aaosphaeria arxii CBS 175.79]KAF2011006.1 splicing factor, CC1-like protein [Aaosphaeria arxii CBS 175.79]
MVDYDPLAIEAFLDSTAAEVEAEKRSKEAAARRSSSDARSVSRDRKDDRDRRDRDRDRDRARDRDSNRDRDRRDRDRNRNRDYRESNNEGDRSRERERRRRDGSRPSSSHKDANTDDEGSFRRNDRSRDRRGPRDRDRDRRGGDFYTGGGRARSRSPRRRDRDDGRNRLRSDRSRDRRRRDDDRRGPATPPKPELNEDDKDKRTVFVQQISQRAETRHLRAFFEAVGTVVEAQIVTDRVTGRSKGVGYVEFKELESVAKAIELTGQKLKGVPIIAQLTEAEKNRASRAAAADANGSSNPQAPFHRLYVGNIHFSITEEDLETVFGPYGELEHVQLQRDEAPNGGAGRSRGYGFVQYRDPAAAKSALETMNGFELANRQIRVGLGNDKFTPESTANLLRNFNQQASSYQGSAFSGAGGRGAYAGGSGGVFDRTHGRDDRGVTGASALDDNDVAGININNMNRDRLMNLLARNPVDEPSRGNAHNSQAAIARSRAPVVEQPMASRCIKINDAFSPEEEQKQWGANWVKDLEAEVKHECDKKYGKVVHIAVDPNTDGDIYVKFDTVTAGEKAIQGLNGRTFNFRHIRASYVVDKIYNSLYGLRN